jgi:hypothetical protein
VKCIVLLLSFPEFCAAGSFSLWIYHEFDSLCKTWAHVLYIYCSVCVGVRVCIYILACICGLLVTRHVSMHENMWQSASDCRGNTHKKLLAGRSQEDACSPGWFHLVFCN